MLVTGYGSTNNSAYQLTLPQVEKWAKLLCLSECIDLQPKLAKLDTLQSNNNASNGVSKAREAENTKQTLPTSMQHPAAGVLTIECGNSDTSRNTFQISQ